MLPPPASSSLFPYTTLFRSGATAKVARLAAAAAAAGRHGARCRSETRGMADLDSRLVPAIATLAEARTGSRESRSDRKSTRLNSSHEWISYAVFCLKKKKHI